MTWTAPTLADARVGGTVYVDHAPESYHTLPEPTPNIAAERSAHPEFDYCWTNTDENTFLGVQDGCPVTGSFVDSNAFTLVNVAGTESALPSWITYTSTLRASPDNPSQVGDDYEIKGDWTPTHGVSPGSYVTVKELIIDCEVMSVSGTPAITDVDVYVNGVLAFSHSPVVRDLSG